MTPGRGRPVRFLAVVAVGWVGMRVLLLLPDAVEVVTRGDVRRAKLYYLRNLRGKAAKIKERRDA